MFIKTQTGTTLIEALLAGVVFILAVSGVFATMAAVRGPVTSKNNSVEAAIFGKQVLEDLRSKVDARDYNNNNGNLGIGTHTIVNGIYTALYNVTPLDVNNPNTSGRKVDVSVTWTDPT